MKPKRNRSAPVSARETAFEIFSDVLSRKPLDVAFERHLDLSTLDEKEQVFVRALIFTVLRRLGQIDDLVKRCLKSSLAPKAAEAKTILRLGTAQLMFMNVPPHAAVDQAVAQATGSNRAPYRKLINAVLRRLAREGAAWLETQDPERLNTPKWLWESWTSAYGAETCRKIAAAHQGVAPLDLSAKSDAERWARDLDASLLPTGTIRLRRSGNVTRLPGYRTGDWWVQDAAAALPARLFGDVAGKSVVDLCAAPGGKTAQLCAYGADVIAVDRSEKRLARLNDNLERLGFSAQTVGADAATWRPPALADSVLLDAPCSATGTIRRHPDALWTKSPADVERLVDIQARLLRAAIEMVKPGGTVVYCTCSLQPEEGPHQIARLLADGAPVERVPVGADEVGGLAEALTPDGDLRTLPCHWADKGGMDGFYACRLRKA